MSLEFLTLFFNTKSGTSPKNLRKIFQSLLMFCYFIKLNESSYFELIMQSTPEGIIIPRLQKITYVLIKLEPHIILELFLNFSDCEPQYSYKLYSFKKGRMCMI